MSKAAPNRPAPPRPAPKPGQVKVFRAMYRYEAQNRDELTFDEGDMLYVLDMTEPGWWKARCNGKTGLIPSNYIEESMETVDYPMHEAAKRGNLNLMKECITNQVSVNGLDKAGSTPLHWASHGGHTHCMEALLAVPRCEVNVQNKLGDTALHSAAWKGHADAVELLLERGGDIMITNNENKTPFELAREPRAAALLQQASKPRQYSADYGDEGDSD